MLAVVGVVVAIVAVVCILWLDRPLLRMLNRIGVQYSSWSKRTADLAGSTPILLGAALLLAVAVTERWRRLAAGAGAVFVCVAGAGLAVNVVKFIFGRYRPKAMWNGRVPGEGPVYAFRWFETANMSTSFPSGHAVTAFALATALSMLTPRWAWLWFTWAVVAAAARVPALAHFPSDVVVGAYFGTVAALLLFRPGHALGLTLFDAIHGRRLRS